MRYGRIGSTGQSITKDFANVAAAMQDAHKLVASKRKKGYKDVQKRVITLEPVEPEMLDYPPIDEAQVALFTPDVLDDTSMRFWKAQLPTLLEGVEGDQTACPLHDDMQVLAQEMETIAAWSCPDVQKAVQRDRGGFAQIITYSINGVDILLLKAGAWDKMAVPHRCIPTMFLGGDEFYGAFYLFGLDFLKQFRQVLTRLSRFCAERIVFLREKQQVKRKEMKIKSVADANIPMVVAAALKGTGYEYILDDGAKGSSLSIKLEAGREGASVLELSLPHKSFLQRAGDILPTVERAKALLDGLPLSVRLGYKSSEITAEWGGVYKMGGWEYDETDFQETFWNPRISQYVSATLFAGDYTPTSQRMPLDEIAQWHVEGLAMEVARARGRVDSIQIKIPQGDALPHANGSLDLFYIDEDGITFDLVDLDELEGKDLYDLAEDGNSPPIENWEAFIKGFSAFYFANLEEVDATRGRYRQWLKTMEGRMEKLADGVRELFQAEGREWAFVERGVQRQSAAIVHVKVKGRKTLSILIPYGDIAPQFQQIAQTVEMVEKAIAECNIAFKLFTLHSYKYHWKSWKIAE